MDFRDDYRSLDQQLGYQNNQLNWAEEMEPTIEAQNVQQVGKYHQQRRNGAADDYDSSCMATGKENHLKQKAITYIEEYITMYKSAIEQLQDPQEKIRELAKLAENPLVLLHYKTLLSDESTPSSMVAVSSKQLPATITTASVSQEHSYASVLTNSVGPKYTYAPDRKPSSNSKNTIKEGKFIVIMEPRGRVQESPKDILYHVIRKTDKNRVKNIDTDGKKLRAYFASRREANDVCKLLDQARYKGTKVREQFNIKTELEPAATIKSIALETAIVMKFPFVVDGKIDQEIAAKVIKKRNGDWFHLKEEIEKVDMRRVHSGKIVLTIETTAKVEQRILAEKIKNRKLDCDGTLVDVFVTVEKQECFNCLKPGHIARQCKEEKAKCQYCALEHGPGECKATDPTKYRCYNCTLYNTKCEDVNKLRPIEHHATSTLCPEVRKNRKEVLRQRQKEARMKHHV